MRLIDADKLMEFAKNHVNGSVDCNDIARFPRVDAVPVLRCKECMHYRNSICEQIEYIMDGYYHGTFEEKRPDDFCSYGEKKNRGKVFEDD